MFKNHVIYIYLSDYLITNASVILVSFKESLINFFFKYTCRHTNIHIYMYDLYTLFIIYYYNRMANNDKRRSY